MNIKQAIKYLEEERFFEVEDISKVKYILKDEEIEEYFNDDRDLIEFAEEQKEDAEYMDE
jgi:hypothetical protein